MKIWDILRDKPKSVYEMTDEELLTAIANFQDWGEEHTINIAAKEANDTITYSDFFKTKTLTPAVRHELRRAYKIWNK